MLKVHAAALWPAYYLIKYKKIKEYACFRQAVFDKKKFDIINSTDIYNLDRYLKFRRIGKHGFLIASNEALTFSFNVMFCLHKKITFLSKI
ncbi:hypothetical protein BpHYR1_040022 [Brachionus plicatilis]|uniref:Uncharacterized protein n=1 Tax=Brachionus plicatilis TaxID=10195 RepID=A0A3M7T1W7_BRAPC|nr:hypothetical protein BpHYR1_040022 [Brachionus plicatilis]